MHKKKKKKIPAIEMKNAVKKSIKPQNVLGGNLLHHFPAQTFMIYEENPWGSDKKFHFKSTVNAGWVEHTG